MIKAIKLSFLALIILVTGCAGNIQQPVAFNYSTIEQGAKVGVVVGPIPTPTMTYPGASCLLCLATAATANASLSAYAKTLDASDLSLVRDDVVASLQSQGFDANVIEEYEDESKLPKIKSEIVNSAKRDYSIYRTKNNVDYLVVVNFNYAGLTRNYASYIAKGAPEAKVLGLVRMIDLNTNMYTIYQPVVAAKMSEGEWKEPPEYPGMTNAYYQAIEAAKDQVKDSVVAVTEAADTGISPTSADAVE
ncbi:hypothetical protein [Teredinibacter waterburyi]|uniref:hypothetical protein n=1 Tax=Teredinibacter waterburyi TaxID=1500538 RepID=UPI00165F04A9|nr:hypothetical protein [Teredinibacter waterburyi]